MDVYFKRKMHVGLAFWKPCLNVLTSFECQLGSKI